jgi:sulfur carrier protein ThiS
MNIQEQLERQAKIATGLKIAYERMLEFKRQKNSEVVVMRDGKIVHLKL